jgi:cytochrome c551/c552
MNNNKVALMVIAVVAIGIFALPSTLSLFAGQHVWYDLEGAGNDVPCEKCHAEIFDEYMLSVNGVHKTLAEGEGRSSNELGSNYSVRKACGACHRIATEGTFASGEGDGSTPGKEAHAAATIACMACHSVGNQSTSNWWAPYAGGFKEMNNLAQNESEWQYADANHTGEIAAHNAFIIEALKDDTLQDANEACLACHTMIAVKINWTHRRALEFDIGLDSPVTTDSGVHNWTIDNWAINGTANATVWGLSNGTGVVNYTSEWPGNIDGIYN